MDYTQKVELKQDEVYGLLKYQFKWLGRHLKKCGVSFFTVLLSGLVWAALLVEMLGHSSDYTR